MNAPFKIIVESRNAAEGHSGNFLYQLPEVTHIGKYMVAYINQASVSNSFLSVGAYVGSKCHYFYWFERILNNNTVFNRVPLPEQSYDAESLAAALQTAMNNASWFGGDMYTVTFNESKNTITVAKPFDGTRTFFLFQMIRYWSCLNSRPKQTQELLVLQNGHQIGTTCKAA